MASIYDITGDKFFVPLASKNRVNYVNAILFLHDVINDLFENDENNKSKVVDSLCEYLDDRATIKLYNDDSGEEVEDLTDNRTKAIIEINNLINYGWLVEEIVEDSRTTIDFTENAYGFIALIQQMMKNQKITVTSIVKNIKQNIENFSYATPDSLELVDSSLQAFVVALRSLRSSIQKFYKNITKNQNNATLTDLLNEFTGEYREYFFNSNYLSLKIRDNVDIQIPKFKEQLDEIFNDLLNVDKLIQSRIDKDYPNFDSALNYYIERRKNIYTNINSIPIIIGMIDSKNEQYVSRTVNVIIHMITRGQDISGIIHRLIEFVKEDEIDDNFISLFEMKHYGFSALSRPRKTSVKTVPEMIKMNLEISDEVKQHALDIVKEDMKYNIRAVNSFALEFLGDQKERKISELEMNSNYEFIMMICIIMYSKIAKAEYQMKALDERITKNGISFNDFLLRRKGEKYDD